MRLIRGRYTTKETSKREITTDVKLVRFFATRQNMIVASEIMSKLCLMLMSLFNRVFICLHCDTVSLMIIVRWLQPGVCVRIFCL